jgi:molybdopterin biosynthesis enzyme
MLSRLVFLAVAIRGAPGQSWGMSRTQPSNGALTSLEAALAELLDGLAPVAPIFVPVDEARGRIAAETAAARVALPARNKAIIDGWALRSLDLAGASSYSPVPLSQAPAWVEAGDDLPDGCDCVLKADLVETVGPLAQAFADAIPGEGTRRAGEDLASDRPVAIAGRPLESVDLLVARAGGHETLAVRAPRVLLLDVAAGDGCSLATQLIAELLEKDGADVSRQITARDVGAIADALGATDCDLAVTVGGTGFGHFDATVEAIGLSGQVIAHGIALRPGFTAAVGRLREHPAVALPGAPDQAFSVYHALVRPVLDRLAGRAARAGIELPLARKISSMVGMAEIALLQRRQSGWFALAVGNLLLDHLRIADAFALVAGGSEGYPAGASVEGYLLRDT